MLATASVCARAGISFLQLGAVLGLLWLVSACQSTPPTEPSLNIRLYQSWQLQPGDSVSGFSVLGGLGDISIDLNHQPVYAPFNGRAHADPHQCVLFASPDVPAYLFRLCGLDRPRFGTLTQGEVIGSGAMLQFAALRKQPNGTWALVEPSKQILERTLRKS